MAWVQAWTIHFTRRCGGLSACKLIYFWHRFIHDMWSWLSGAPNVGRQ